MLAASNFVNQMHNGTQVSNSSTMAEVGNLESEASPQMAANNNTTTKQTNYNSSNTVPPANCSLEEQSMPVSQSGGLNGDCSHQQPEEAQNCEESVDITISNVVTSFSVRCHLNLRQIATKGSNVVYRRDHSIILMKIRQPLVTASIWSSGRITCTGATTEESAKRAARRVARCLQKLGFRVRFGSYRIVNVLGACKLPFGIKIHEFSDRHRPLASYEPELHPGATYRIKELKAVLKIFQTGSITITAPSVRNVQLAVEHIYPMVYEFRKPKPRGPGTHNPNPEEDHKDALMYDKLDQLSSSSSDDDEDA